MKKILKSFEISIEQLKQMLNNPKEKHPNFLEYINKEKDNLKRLSTKDY